MAPDNGPANGSDMATLTTWLRRCAVAVAAVTFALSFYGLDDFAQQSMKLPWWLAWIVPAGLDGLTLVAIAATFLLRHKAWHVRAYAWLVFAVAAGLSMAGNHQHAVKRHLDDAGTAGFTVAPVVLALASHLVVVTWRSLERRDERDTVEVQATPAPAIPPSATTEPRQVANPVPNGHRPTSNSKPAKRGDRSRRGKADPAAIATLKAAGQTQKQVATRLGISERSVARYWSGAPAIASVPDADDDDSTEVA